MSEEQNKAPQQDQEQVTPKQGEQKRKYTPPTIHAVDIRKDRNGIDYAVSIGKARQDKRDGYGDLMKMGCTTVSGFYNIMTDKGLREFRAKTQQERFECQNSERSRSE